jgi:hypothetical protein
VFRYRKGKIPGLIRSLAKEPGEIRACGRGGGVGDFAGLNPRDQINNKRGM